MYILKTEITLLAVTYHTLQNLYYVVSVRPVINWNYPSLLITTNDNCSSPSFYKEYLYWYSK